MSEAQKEDDPSIEEILDSIRQIISDDDKEDTAGEDAPVEEEAVAPEPVEEEAAPEPEPEPAPEPEPEDDQDDDVVELTEKVEEEPEAISEPEEPAEEEKEQEVIEIDMTEPEEQEGVAAPEPEPAPPPPPPPRPKPTPSGDVLSNGAERATEQAFDNLARTAMVERSGQATLEDIVRQEIRPLLKEWLDDYLPGIVERLLEKELQRISSRYLDD